MSDTNERLVYMANQIARNFMALGHDEAVRSTAEHIEQFWDPRMREQILAGDRAALSSEAAEAVELLAAKA